MTRSNIPHTTSLLLSRSNTILDSIDIGAVQKLSEKVSKNILGQLENHRKEINLRSRNFKAIEMYLPTIEMFAAHVKEILENGKTATSSIPLKGNSGFKHLSQEDIAGTRIINSTPSKDPPPSSPNIKGWTSESLLYHKK